MRNLKDRVFDRLKVLEFAGRDKYSAPLWKVQCGCDLKTILIVKGSHLETRHTKSCGCLQRERATELGFKHGAATPGKVTHEYHVHHMMVQRCTNPDATKYENYGGRGIAVCERWLKFENFLADMGPCPPGLTLERKDNYGNYEPGNCRWATSEEQQNNRRNNHRLTFNDKTQTVSQWARELGLKPKILFNRLQYGWPISRILTTL